MKHWTALVPFKRTGERKTRLAARLSAGERVALSERLFAHVTGVLSNAARIGSVVVIEDRGGGLNAELAAARGAGPVAVFHADLPLLNEVDVIALLDAAESAGCAIAPDRHGEGTNALAIADERPFAFRFGAGSFAAHRAEAGAEAAIVGRVGLSHDIDTPSDLELALELGFERIR